LRPVSIALMVWRETETRGTILSEEYGFDEDHVRSIEDMDRALRDSAAAKQGG
jgi:hypothetical protein